MTTSRGSLVYLITLAFIASLGGFLFGYDTGVISGCTAQLQTQFHLTAAGLGFVTGCAILGCIVGAIIAGWLADHFGRKAVLVLAAALFCYSAFGTMMPELALAGISLSNDDGVSTVRLLIFARFLGGVGIGIASMVSPLYLAEISPARVRGATVAYYQLAITLGMVTCYFMNAKIHAYAEAQITQLEHLSQFQENGLFGILFITESWRAMFGAAMVPAMIFLLLVFFAPESPRWLCMKGKTEKARKIFTKLAGVEAAEYEIAAVKKVLAEEKGSFFELFSPKLRVALLVGFFLPILGQFSGINAIMYYGPDIFVKGGMGISSSFESQVFIGIVNVVCTFGAILLVDRIGRRPLILWGSVGLIISLIWIGVNTLTGITFPYLVIAPFLLFIACFAFSLGPLPWIVISEIFPARIRGQAMSVGVFAIWMGCYLVTQLFPILRESIGQGSTFFIFAVLVSFTIPLVIFLIPETKGKTLEEIQEDWNDCTGEKK